MKTNAKIRPILTLVIFLFTCVVLSVTAIAADAVFEGNYNERISFKLFPTESGDDEQKYLLKISGEGDFDAVNVDGTPLSYDTKDNSILAEYAENIVEADIGDGITRLGNYALAFMKNLRKVTIPSTLTELGNAVFEGDEKLHDILLRGGKIQSGADLTCITKMSSYTFVGCLSLEEITFSDELDSPIGKRNFDRCRSLRSLSFPKGVRMAYSEFIRDCSSLRYVSFASDVSFEGGAFNGAPASFYVCSPEDGRTSTYVTELGVKYGGSDPEKIPYAPDSDAIDSGICGDMLFWQIKKAENFDETAPKYKLYIYGEGNTIQLKDIYGNNVGYGSVVESAYAKYTDNIVSADICESVTNIGNYSFARLGGLKEITLPTHLERIGGAAFEGCGSLEIMSPRGVTGTIGVLDLSGVDSFEQYAFDGLLKMTSVVFSDTLSMKELGRETFKRTGLTSIVIPKCIKKIGERAFEGCSSLTDVKILGEASIASDAFRKCDKLQTITAFSGSDAEALADELGIEFRAPFIVTIRNYADHKIVDSVEVITGESIKNFTFGGKIYLPYFDEELKKPYTGEAFTETATLYVHELYSLDGISARLTDGEEIGLRARFRLNSNIKNGNTSFEVTEVGALASRDRAGARIPLTLDMKKVTRTIFVSGGENTSDLCSIPLANYEKFAVTAVGFADDNGNLVTERCNEELYFRGYVIIKNRKTGEDLTFYTDMKTTSLSAHTDSVPHEFKKSETRDDIIAEVTELNASNDALVCIKPDLENVSSVALALENYYNENGDIPGVFRLDTDAMVAAKLTSDENIDKFVSILARYAKNGGKILLVHRPPNPCSESGSKSGMLTSTEASYVLDRGTVQGKKYLSDLGDVGKLMQMLKNKGVPLMIEFLPDISSQWYWWCAAGETEDDSEAKISERYIALWRYTMDYLEKECELNNIIAIYRGGNNAEDYYPGADYVDVYGKNFAK